jgi:hypothetical protein
MMSQEKNNELTRVGPGTPAGEMLRQYWMPAALTEELNGGRPVVPVTLLGETLALFRRPGGALALMERHCPHRGADMCFGRVEEDGIRCPFHGWKFDHNGQCLEQPAEPEGSRMHEKIRIRSYPVVERNGMVFAYMGTGEPPAFPAFDCFMAPDSHVFAFKGLWECNWLQALEVGIDPAHASFLHRFLLDEDPVDSYGKQFRDTAADTDIPMTRLLREFPRPDIHVEETDYGLRIIALRDLQNGSSHVRVTNQVFPCAITIPMSNEMTITQWHVPVDDEHCYWYAIFTSFGAAVDKATMRAQRLELYELPDYVPKVGKHNNYGFDPYEQAAKTYTGMGMDINVHDQWAVESPGPIQDRTREHLGRSDVGITAYRRMLRKALADQDTAGAVLPLGVGNGGAAGMRGPVAIDAIGPRDAWEACWKDRDKARREASGWAPDPW